MSKQTVTEEKETTPGIFVPKDQDKNDEYPSKDLGFFPMPSYLRYNPEEPPKFGIALNIYFGFASTFTVANLYYCQPILVQLADSFGVTYDEVSRIPTLVQAGYAVGLVLISPTGDLLRRRQLILIVVTLSCTLTIGLAITNNVQVFSALGFLVGIFTVTPQILLPLAADLAPPHRRASVVSVVFTGLLFGVLVARVLSGVISQFVSWRVVYYMSVGVQGGVLIGCYFMIPDYPAKNQDMSYFGILKSMVKLAFTEPMLIQACLINLASSAAFVNFWVTLTFLLDGAPYHFSTLAIGLFSLVGIFGVSMGPLIGHSIDRVVPWFASLIAIMGLAVSQAVQTGAGGINIGAVVVATIGIDTFRQMLQVSLIAKLFSIAPESRARLNAVFILALFIGQVMGTSVGSKVFLDYGWRAGAALSLGFSGWQLFILLLRGPHCARYTWIGYEGGFEWRKTLAERKGLVTPAPALPSNDESLPARDENTSKTEKNIASNDTTNATI